MNAANILHSTLALVGGTIFNGMAPRTTSNRYHRWGFSVRLRFQVAASQLIAAGLLIAPVTQRLGSALALTLMVSVICEAIRRRKASTAVAARAPSPSSRYS